MSLHARVPRSFNHLSPSRYLPTAFALAVPNSLLVSFKLVLLTPALRPIVSPVLALSSPSAPNQPSYRSPSLHPPRYPLVASVISLLTAQPTPHLYTQSLSRANSNQTVLPASQTVLKPRPSHSTRV
ncbi:hypothetical protein PCASD_23954 [Puccinia coronata f. sp. avenae]|uniref:Uncharacterized protein n=1 Tax=Puccinia coronata f. sp. avenae TaxID=200324 RepID=A0A2N5U0V5_9BASI|nr:hypothetical protein PCASD_23954 [Puccinia coronata f. sp. avenae]